jgi:glutathione synthase
MADLISSDAGAPAGAIESAMGLNPEEISYLIQDSVAWAGANGLQMATDPVNFTHAPFALLPFKYAKEQFEQSKALAPLYNVLVDNVSRDLEWIYSTLESVLDSDKFTARLVDLCKAVHAEGNIQPAYLGILRSDYMLDQPEDSDVTRLLQVEINCIASSFGCLSGKVCQLHNYTLTRHAQDYPAMCAELTQNATGSSADSLPGRLPANDCMQKIPAAMAQAHALYLQQQAEPAPTVVVFVVQPGEVNTVDQRILEHSLWDSHGIRAERWTMSQVRALLQRARVCADSAGNRLQTLRVTRMHV